MLAINEELQQRYRIKRRLGQGGMGAVYEAEDTKRFGKSVALKEISIDLTKVPTLKHQEILKRAFEREAKILTQLDHEAFPQVIDYFTETDRQYLVMELIQGDDLEHQLRKRENPFSLNECLDLANQLLEALDYLHTLNQPIVHRDIKPQNIKITPRGRIKLLDFGIAKGSENQLNTTVTNQTFIAATLNYSPFEQIFRVLDENYRDFILEKYNLDLEKILAQNVDARSDIYALGATLYHLLTGLIPVDALKRSLEVWSGKPDLLQSPTILNKEINIEISNWLLKSMAIYRDERFSSALEMQSALQGIILSQKSQEEEIKRQLWLQAEEDKRQEWIREQEWLKNQERLKEQQWLREQERLKEEKRFKEREKLNQEREQIEAARQKFEEEKLAHLKQIEEINLHVSHGNQYQEQSKIFESEPNKIPEPWEQKAANQESSISNNSVAGLPLTEAAFIDFHPPKGNGNSVDFLDSTKVTATDKLVFSPNFVQDSRPSNQPEQELSMFRSVGQEYSGSRRINKKLWLIFGTFGLLMLVAATVLIKSNWENTATDSNSSLSKNSSTNTLPNNAANGLSQMASVVGGEFIMGRDDSKNEAERPAHKVTVGSFLIDIYETTNEQYAEFIKATGHKLPTEWKNGNFPKGQAKFPVVGINWDDATAFAKWADKRLPTEEEWEFAARGPENLLYPWGNNWKSGVANIDGASKSLTEVGKFKEVSPFGLYDMAGNAGEWTASDFNAYPNGKLSDYYAGKSNLKTIRGGDFITPKDFATTAYRIGWAASGGSDYSRTGFRCAKDVEK